MRGVRLRVRCFEFPGFCFENPSKIMNLALIGSKVLSADHREPVEPHQGPDWVNGTIPVIATPGNHEYQSDSDAKRIWKTNSMNF